MTHFPAYANLIDRAMVKDIHLIISLGSIGMVIGVITGTLQWLLLRRSVPTIGWWVIVSGLSWSAGLAMGGLLNEAFWGRILAGMIAGTITGVALIFVNRKSNRGSI